MYPTIYYTYYMFESQPSCACSPSLYHAGATHKRRCLLPLRHSLTYHDGERHSKKFLIKFYRYVSKRRFYLSVACINYLN
jgi:hypothetical protein